MSKFNYKPKIISQTPTNQFYKNKKRSTSQIKYQKAPDIMTQSRPAYLNNFIQPVNPHQSAFTPTNRSKNLDQKKFLLPQKSPEFSGKKTLILDLDETLVHSSFVPFEKNDIVLNVDFESVMYNIYVLVRPGAEDFIKKVSKYYEVIIFTASIAKYALPLLEIIDNEKNIKYKLTREHCTFLNGIYIKELKKLNRDLKDLIIVDNSPLAYAFDSDNGLPIKGWYDDKEDKELEKIFPILEFLADTKDVRYFIHKFVNNNEIIYNMANELMKNNNEKKDNNLDIIGNNKTNNNKEDTEKKVISVNIKINAIKNKTKNINDNSYASNNKENNANNNASNNKENNIKNNQTILKDNYISKILYDKKDISFTYNISNTNYNFNKSNSRKEKIFKNNYAKEKINNNKNILIQKKGKKISDNKTYNIFQRKKNSFRIRPKLGEKKMLLKNTSTTNNIHLKYNSNNYFINNNKYSPNINDNDFPIGLSLSNTTKTRPSSKTQVQYNINHKINKTISKSKNISLKKNISYDKTNTLNYNSINKKYKYTNLIEQLENKTIKSNCSLNNKSQTNSKSTNIFNAKNMLQKKKLSNNNKSKKLNYIRVSSSLIGKYQSLIINNSLTDNKIINTNNHVSRSKSTGNFINFTKKFQKPKTPKGQFIFERKNMVGISKDKNKNNKKGINLINGFSRTTRHSNNRQVFIKDDIKKNNVL